MGRRKFTPEFKLEAVKLVLERGMTATQASRDLGLHVNVLRKWVQEAKQHGAQAFPGQGRMRPDDAEVARLMRMAGLQARRTSVGWPTSPISGPPRAGCTLRPYSTCTRDAWSAGRPAAR